jgi:hypothetical protein
MEPNPRVIYSDHEVCQLNNSRNQQHIRDLTKGETTTMGTIDVCCKQVVVKLLYLAICNGKRKL